LERKHAVSFIDANLQIPEIAKSLFDQYPIHGNMGFTDTPQAVAASAMDPPPFDYSDGLGQFLLVHSMAAM
jgi:hypothetical protein